MFQREHSHHAQDASIKYEIKYDTIVLKRDSRNTPL